MCWVDLDLPELPNQTWGRRQRERCLASLKYTRVVDIVVSPKSGDHSYIESGRICPWMTIIDALSPLDTQRCFPNSNAALTPISQKLRVSTLVLFVIRPRATLLTHRWRETAQHPST